MTTEAGKYVIAKAVWDEGMRGHFIRMFSVTGPQDVEIMVGKIEKEARIAALTELREKIMANEDEWETTYSAEQGVSLKKLLAAIDRRLT
jgi:AAA+ ATPase superfamily predicted ATPase